jgi:hypothetical protein
MALKTILPPGVLCRQGPAACCLMACDTSFLVHQRSMLRVGRHDRVAIARGWKQRHSSDNCDCQDHKDEIHPAEGKPHVLGRSNPAGSAAS